MKKLIFILVLCTGLAGLLSAEDKGISLYISPGAYLTGGSSNGFRGFAGGLDVKLDLWNVITPGVQALFEYDSYFSSGNVPVLFQLGFGPDFWIGAGTTINMTPMTLGGITYRTAGFPDTFGLGVGFDVIPLGDKSALKIAGQVTYTNTVNDSTGSSLTDSITMLAGILANLRAYVGVQFQLGL